MDYMELKVAITRKGLSIPKLADMIGLGKKSLYCRINGELPFTQKEISNISKVLDLDSKQIMDIFFTDLVS